MADPKELPPSAFPRVKGVPVMSMAKWSPPPETKEAAEALLGLGEHYEPPPPIKEDQHAAASGRRTNQ